MIDSVRGDQLPETRVSGGFRPLPGWLLPLLLLLFGGGAAAFLGLLASSRADRAWAIFLVNFLFWSGAAMAGVVLPAIFQISNARWPIPIKGLAEACAAYLPVSFLWFLVSWFGRRSIFPWASHSEQVHSAWLDTSSLYGREAVALLLLYGIGILFIARSMRAGSPMFVDPRGNHAPRARERDRSPQTLAIVVLILYALLYTLFAWDFVMSLDPSWTSTLFGAFYFVGNLYLGLAILTLLVLYSRWRYDLTAAAGNRRLSSHSGDSEILRNFGKLLLTFSLLWVYFFWSQYIVIWYGNLPHETEFLLVRFAQEPWKILAVSVLLLNFVIPFVLLLPRGAKENKRVLLATSVTIATGIWLESFLLVVPSLAPHPRILFGWSELLITAGFFASFALTYLLVLSWIPRLAKS